MNCKYCKSPISEDVTTCAGCGQPLEASNLSKEKTEGKVGMTSSDKVNSRKCHIATVVGILIILINMTPLVADLKHVPLSQNLKDILSAFRLVQEIAATGWVVDIARRLGRSVWKWGLFAFFLPPIALIIIGQKRPLPTENLA